MQLSPHSIVEHLDYPCKETPDASVPPALGNQESTSFLYVCLFWTFHVNGLIQHVVLGDWLLSLTIVFLKPVYGLMVKNPPANQEMRVRPLDQEYPWRRKWQPTPVFLPGKSHGQRSLTVYCPWGHKESDSTELLTLSVFMETCGSRRLF